MKKMRRFVKGSAEAKRYMATLRGLKEGRLKKRKETYVNGLYTARHKRKVKKLL